MNICIDLTNISKGGGIQVAKTFLDDLLVNKSFKFEKIYVLTLDHSFDEFDKNDNKLKFISLTKILKNNLFINTIKFNKIFKNYDIKLVFTLFGPAYFFTKRIHIVGFARPHIVYTNSLYFKKLKFLDLIYVKFKYTLLSIIFYLQADVLIVESNDVKDRLSKKILFYKKNIVVIENTINQAFINYNFNSQKNLDKLRILFVSSYYDHKNFEFFIELANNLSENYSNFPFLITLTLKESEFLVPNNIKKYFNFIGKIDVKNLPPLYKEHNLVIHPSLLECFSACYIESVYTKTMLIVSDFSFSRSILNDYPFYVKNMDVNKCISIIFQNFPKFYTNNEIDISYFENYFNSIIRTSKYLKIIEKYNNV